MRYLFLSSITLLCNIVSAQFAGPNASAYNPATKSYYITNYYGKNVVTIDENNNKDTFIDNLTAPNNILFEKLPLGSAFIILDSNEIKAYDSAGNFYAKFSTPGAQKLQDAVFNKVSNTLYISDVLRGVIYKTTFGPAPFYFPTTVIFSTPFRKPSAMVLQQSKNRILYVEDTIGGNLMELNLSTGKTSLLKSLNMDNLVGLAEDGQGNLYLSSKGLKAIYQLNKYYSGIPKKRVSEPLPGDLYVNVSKDRWVYTCIQCGTVYIAPLHLFGPGLEIMGCQGDSFYCYKNYLHNNIGTFENGNTFIMEMSNSSGSFSQSTVLNSISDTVIPLEMNGIIPKNAAAGTNYKIRWRSTKPAIIGNLEVMHIYPKPEAFISNSDSLEICIGNKVELGRKHSNDSGNTYTWSPAHLVDTANKSKVLASTSASNLLFLTVKNNYGCISKDSIFLQSVSILNPGFMRDTISACKGDSIFLGSATINGVQYQWSLGYLLNDSVISNPVYLANSSKTFTLFYSSNGGCAGSTTQTVITNQNPIFSIFTDSQTICANNIFINRVVFGSSDSQYLIQWHKATNIDTGNSSEFTRLDSGIILVTAINQYNCRSNAFFTLSIYPNILPKLQLMNDSILYITDTLHKIEWYKNDTLLLDSGQQIQPNSDGSYKACGLTKYDCLECTPNLIFKKMIQISGVNHFKSKTYIYPNPAYDKIYIQSIEQNLEWKLMNMDGRMIQRGNGEIVTLNNQKTGIYLLEINQKNRLIVYKQ